MLNTVHTPSPHLMTSTEAAAASGYSPSTISRMARDGRLATAQTIGYATARPVRLFDPADVAALAAERVAEHERIVSAIRAAGKAAQR